MSLEAMFDVYQQFQTAHPLIGTMLTAEVTFSVGDIVSQLVIDKKVNWKKVRYSMTLAPVYGAGLYGLMETGDVVGRTVSEHPFVKSALGPNLWGHLLNTFFFVNNTIGEKTNYSITGLLENYKATFSSQGDNIKEKVKSLYSNFKEKYIQNIPGREFRDTTIATLTFWNAFQTANYAYIQDEMRTPAILATSLVWLSILSLWSLRGSRRLTQNSDS